MWCHRWIFNTHNSRETIDSFARGQRYHLLKRYVFIWVLTKCEAARRARHRARRARHARHARHTKSKKNFKKYKKIYKISKCRTSLVDWFFLTRKKKSLVCDNTSSYNLPSVTQSLFRDQLSRLFALLWNIPGPFLYENRSKCNFKPSYSLLT